MVGKWENAFAELKEFVNQHPAIEVEPNIVSIPANVRPEFYRLFDAVRVRFVKEYNEKKLQKTYKLALLWKNVGILSIGSTEVGPIEVDEDVKWILANPDDGLIRFIFDPLFDLLKGKINSEGFKTAAAAALEGAFDKFIREIYKYWVVLAITKIISADKLYKIPETELDRDPYAHMETLASIEGIVEKCPVPVETKEVSFKHRLKFAFLQPALLVHSAGLGRFVAFVPDYEFNESRWDSRSLASDRQWYTMKDIVARFGKGDLWPDLAIYLSDSEKNLSLAADHTTMGQPDIIIEIRPFEDWYDKEGLESVKRHYEVLQPKLGSYIVCLEAAPDELLNRFKSERSYVSEQAGEKSIDHSININLIQAGYDSNKLQPIAVALGAADPTV